jgi:3D (Asp-Asp-Asp) domain-containing protein
LGPFLAAVVCGVVGIGVTPASSAEAPSYRLRVDAVAYSLPGKTASGLPVGKGVVAVDPGLIPLRTRLFVPGYGRAVAADVGIAVKGRIIDLWFPTTDEAREWGRKTVVITVYG